MAGVHGEVLGRQLAEADGTQAQQFFGLGLEAAANLGSHVAAAHGALDHDVEGATTGQHGKAAGVAAGDGEQFGGVVAGGKMLRLRRRHDEHRAYAEPVHDPQGFYRGAFEIEPALPWWQQAMQVIVAVDDRQRIAPGR